MGPSPSRAQRQVVVLYHPGYPRARPRHRVAPRDHAALERRPIRKGYPQRLHVPHDVVEARDDLAGLVGEHARDRTGGAAVIRPRLRGEAAAPAPLAPASLGLAFDLDGDGPAPGALDQCGDALGRLQPRGRFRFEAIQIARRLGLEPGTPGNESERQRDEQAKDGWAHQNSPQRSISMGRAGPSLSSETSMDSRSPGRALPKHSRKAPSEARGFPQAARTHCPGRTPARASGPPGWTRRTRTPSPPPPPARAPHTRRSCHPGHRRSPARSAEWGFRSSMGMAVPSQRFFEKARLRSPIIRPFRSRRGPPSMPPFRGALVSITGPSYFDSKAPSALVIS